MKNILIPALLPSPILGRYFAFISLRDLYMTTIVAGLLKILSSITSSSNRSRTSPRILSALSFIIPSSVYLITARIRWITVYSDYRFDCHLQSVLTTVSRIKPPGRHCLSHLCGFVSNFPDWTGSRPPLRHVVVSLVYYSVNPIFRAKKSDCLLFLLWVWSGISI
jgi:hypothetical protein